MDMKRGRRRGEGSALGKRMLTAAYTAMAAATRNHASEFLPDGLFARDKITSQMRERLSGCPMTSTGAERLFAIGRKHAERAAHVARGQRGRTLCELHGNRRLATGESAAEQPISTGTLSARRYSPQPVRLAAGKGGKPSAARPASTGAR